MIAPAQGNMRESGGSVSSRGRRGSMPTINDVARHAGVSPMTVSRVINGESNVRPTTRELVEEAIRALNYAPNMAARSLAGAERHRIGLLYTNPSAGFVNEFLIGSLEQATQRNVQLIFEKCGAGEEGVDVARRLVADGIDGVVLGPPLCESAAVLEVFAATDIPTVLLATALPPEGQLAVSIDDRRAAFEMTRHLLDLGHRRIGFIQGDPNLSASGEREAGYAEALRQGGLPIDAALIVPGRYTYRSGLEATERLLGNADRPTAIFASNDDMAAAAVATANRHGLDVPDDLTVCGFDDTALATAIWPELTTIKQPIEEMSRAAVEMLIDAIRGQRQSDPAATGRLLDFELIRRQSDAAPKRSKRAARS
jgi:LacI family transcriptional regulator